MKRYGHLLRGTRERLKDCIQVVKRFRKRNSRKYKKKKILNRRKFERRIQRIN